MLPARYMARGPAMTDRSSEVTDGQLDAQRTEWSTGLSAPGDCCMTQMISRRAVAASLLAMPAVARAQGSWSPTQPIRVIIPFPPGGTMDPAPRSSAPTNIASTSAATAVIGAWARAPRAHPMATRLAWPKGVPHGPAASDESSVGL
jgi:hypothetical protein